MLPRQLLAPAPGWTAETDVVIVGSGIAGLTPALHITRHSEATNPLTVATAITAAALRREETGGSHGRRDYPGRDDANWRGHLDLALPPNAPRTATYHPSLTPPSLLAGANNDAGGVKGEGQR